MLKDPLTPRRRKKRRQKGRSVRGGMCAEELYAELNVMLIWVSRQVDCMCHVFVCRFIREERRMKRM